MVGNYLPSLSVVRSLVAAGHRVIVGDGGEYSPVRHSRHCHELWQHPPIRRGDDFLAALNELLAGRPEIGIVLPLLSNYLECLARNHDRLPATPVVAMPQPEVVLACLDKDRMYALARDAGVPHHPVERAHTRAELATACERVGYPCVVRPTSDTDVHLPGDRKAVIWRDQPAMERDLQAWPESLASLLVQRYAPGLRHNVFFAARAGAIIDQVHTRILHTDRADGTGLAVDGITIAPDPRLARSSAALVERLGYTGVGFAQFLVPDEGEPHFLELNPRHAGSTAIAAHCGLDLALAAVELATGTGAWQVEAGFRYPVGRRYVWTSRDLYSLSMAVSRSEVGARRALAWLARSLGSAIRADVHLTWSLRDPLPSLAVYAHLLTLGPWRRMRRGRPPI